MSKRKCPDCQSCLKPMNIFNNIYWLCYFCKEMYKVYGEFTKVDHNDLIYKGFVWPKEIIDP